LPAWWLRRSDQTRSHPELGRQTLQRQWYYVSRPGRVGRRQACEAHPILFIDYLFSSAAFAALLFRLRAVCCAVLWRLSLGAGWSSPVARQAHNLKVVSSNLAPATNPIRKTPALAAGVFVCALRRFSASASGIRAGCLSCRVRSAGGVRAVNKRESMASASSTAAIAPR
jgi:hypothetical protein